MMGITSNLSTEEQQATAIAKRKEDDTATMAQATAATEQRMQEALLAVMATVHKGLDKSRVCEHAATLAWEKEKSNACQVEL
jgi:hypothetical protein